MRSDPNYAKSGMYIACREGVPTNHKIEAPLDIANCIVQFGPLWLGISDYWLLCIEIFGVTILIVSTVCAVRQTINAKL